MKKKLLSVLAILLLVITFVAGCGKQSETPAMSEQGRNTLFTHCWCFALLSAAVSKMPTAHASKRILRHPIKEPGKITLQLCTQEGLKTQFVVKKDGAAFKKARKASCGDAFED